MAILLLLAAPAYATGIPEEIEVLNSNAAELGFSVSLLGATDEAKGVRLGFPAKLSDGRMAVRVQTALVDKRGEQLYVHSSDYAVGASHQDGPSVLAAYPPDLDLVFQVQYECGNSICVSFVIKSVSNFLKRSAEKSTPHNQRMQTDEPWSSP